MAQPCADLISNETRNYVAEIAEKLSIKNSIVDVSVGSIRGDNYLGIIAKVEVTGEDEQGKKKVLNLIAKSAPRTGFFRSIAPMTQFYEREIFVYARVLPLYERLQKEKRISKPLNCFAKFYGSIVDDFNEVILMENMKELGYKLCDRRLPLDYEHVAIVLREYGKLHAFSFALRDQQPDVFKELDSQSRDICFSKTFNSEQINESIKMQLDRGLNALEPTNDKVVYEKFKNFLDGIADRLENIVSAESAGEYAVIGHGDCWINNLLFRYDDTENPKLPTKVCLIDWQLSRSASPALDISYLMFSSTDKKLREEHYHDLLAEYYNSLSSTLLTLGSDPEKMFPYEVFEEHLKKFSAYGLYMAVMVLYMITSEVDEIGDINAETKEELLESFNKEKRTIERYNSRMRDVAIDCANYGYI